MPEFNADGIMYGDINKMQSHYDRRLDILTAPNAGDSSTLAAKEHTGESVLADMHRRELRGRNLRAEKQGARRENRAITRENEKIIKQNKRLRRDERQPLIERTKPNLDGIKEQYKDPSDDGPPILET
jgi:hypothetical protein